MFNINFANDGMSEATALQTESQPLPTAKLFALCLDTSLFSDGLWGHKLSIF